MTVAAPLVMMMAGGTGGHVYPALAVADELRARGYRVEWIGTERGLEERVVPAADIELHHLSVRGVRGKRLWHKVQSLFSLGASAVQALWLVARRWPACVVGLGGYVAGPAGVAAWLLRRPLLIHEQNAVAGTTNRLLRPLASRTLAAFPDAFAEQSVTAVVGNPLRKPLLSAAQEEHAGYDGKRALRLLVLGGSLGAEPINRLLPPAVRAVNAQLGEQVLEVWHQAGPAHGESLQQAYGDLLAEQVRVSPFIEDMASAYQWADLVLCRAGALTVSELAVMGRPSLLVPLPHAIDDHQTGNANTLATAGAAVILVQSTLDVDALLVQLRRFIEQPQRLSAMAQAARDVAQPEATQRVCDHCEELIRGRG
jgi:UDP-N-acetylglucosamine--N-acetylmuramyl-(pentapeptide) pyrophosphoryl-undecaprenol N-acetylglucosamine transferase